MSLGKFVLRWTWNTVPKVLSVSVLNISYLIGRWECDDSCMWLSCWPHITDKVLKEWKEDHQNRRQCFINTENIEFLQQHVRVHVDMVEHWATVQNWCTEKRGKLVGHMEEHARICQKEFLIWGNLLSNSSEDSFYMPVHVWLGVIGTCTWIQKNSLSLVNCE